MFAVIAAKVPWVWTTALRVPVVPEVNSSSTGSSGATSTCGDRVLVSQDVGLAGDRRDAVAEAPQARHPLDQPAARPASAASCTRRRRGLLEHVDVLVERQPGVQRHPELTVQDEPEVGRRRVRPVADQQRDVGPLADAGVRERVADAARRAEHVGEAQLVVLPPDRRPVAALRSTSRISSAVVGMGALPSKETMRSLSRGRVWPCRIGPVETAGSAPEPGSGRSARGAGPARLRGHDDAGCRTPPGSAAAL